MIIKPKGTKDVLPQESYKWHYIEEIMRRQASLYNIREIRTPAFEHTDLFDRSIGETTDVVTKEMYTFLDKKGRSITLKPEGTAPVVRAFIESNLLELSFPLKLYYFTPVFRYEAPQEGRLREHHQFGVEFYGGASYETDFEVIYFAYTLLEKLGVENVELRLNSIGCEDCRKNYVNALKDYLAENIGAMCNRCMERYEKNPLRILDCKEDGCRKLLGGAPNILDYICSDCSAHLVGLEGLLKRFKVVYKLDSGIVRGLDYYNRTVFEFVTTKLGAQGTICGGGRYDGLVASLGGGNVPCVGFGMGLERLILLMEKTGVNFPVTDNIDIFICCQDREYFGYCYDLVNSLRLRGIKAETDIVGKSLKAQMKFAGKINVRYTAVVGGNEFATNRLVVKNMNNGELTECESLGIYDIIKNNK